MLSNKIVNFANKANDFLGLCRSLNGRGGTHGNHTHASFEEYLEGHAAGELLVMLHAACTSSSRSRDHRSALMRKCNSET